MGLAQPHSLPSCRFADAARRASTGRTGLDLEQAEFCHGPASLGQAALKDGGPEGAHVKDTQKAVVLSGQLRLEWSLRCRRTQSLPHGLANRGGKFLLGAGFPNDGLPTLVTDPSAAEAVRVKGSAA